MQTAIYIDGFNLYYGCIKGTPYKWLDVPSFFNKTLANINDDFEIVAIKYFTSDVLARFTKHPNSKSAQQNYLNALAYLYPDHLEIIKGKYDSRKFEAIKYNEPPNVTDKVFTWKLEEKLTDVSIAVTIIDDVYFNGIEQIVICSSDTDLIPALSLIRKRFPKVKIGVVIPSRHQNRNASYPCDWYTHVQTEILAVSQLPKIIQKSNRKQIRKPKHW